MWEFLELIIAMLDLTDFCLRWRMLVSWFLAGALIKIIWWLIPSRNVCMGISISLAVAATVLGIVWEARSTK